jgi:hypothetical protein
MGVGGISEGSCPEKILFTKFKEFAGKECSGGKRVVSNAECGIRNSE